jgi:flagellar basal body rod protein FlgB
MPIDPVGVKHVLQAMLDLSQQRAEVASSNIAGSTTPGFRAQRVDQQAFVAQLREAVANPLACDSGCALGLSPQINDAATPPSLDAAVAEMVAASSDYQALLQALNGHLGLMKLAVSGRAQA